MKNIEGVSKATSINLSGEKKVHRAAKKKSDKAVTEYWQPIVKTYFDFCLEKFGRRPSFDGSSPRDLKMIVDYIKTITIEEDKIEWTEKEATERLNIFLTAAHMDKWLRDNFLLLNLNRQKDKILFLKNKFLTDERTTKDLQTRDEVSRLIDERYKK